MLQLRRMPPNKRHEISTITSSEPEAVMKTAVLLFCVSISTACSSRSADSKVEVAAEDAGLESAAWVEPVIPEFEDQCPPGTMRKEKDRETGGKEDWCERPNGQRHGPNRFYYANGAKEFDARLVDGKMEGPVVNYYEDGAKKQYIPFERGLPQGAATFWHENGSMRSTGYYRRLEQEGVWTDYRGDGVKWKETHYVSGVEHGALTEWDEDGKVTRRALYDHGKLVSDTDSDAGASDAGAR